MTNCPKCNTENPTEAKFCENCGNILSTHKPKEKQTKDLNFCPDCGKTIEQDASFCAHCGASFGEQCPQCQAINQANSKFCEKCAQPLNWICPICNNKNQAGAMYCESCGSDTVIKKPKYKDLRYLSAAAIIIVLLGISFIQLNQFDKNLQYAKQNADNDNFDIAYNYISEAKNNWLPFTNNKTEKTKSYVEAKEEDYIQIQEQQRLEQENARRNTKRRSSRSNNSSNSGSSNSNTTYCVGFTSVNFSAGYACIIRNSLSVQRSGYDISTEANPGFSDPYATISDTYGANNCIKGTYSFSWTFYSQCFGGGDPDGPYSYSGTFYLDGEHSVYNVSLGSSGYIDVKGF